MNANDESGAEFWDALYTSREPDPSRDPNPQLAAEAGDLAPGFALDVGCADGCDAGWLAERGWRVTAVDVSNVALDRARAATQNFAERIEWLQADLREWTPAVSTYDLVSAHFVHFLPQERAVVFRRLAAAVRPHGTLLIVGHHPSDLQTTVKRWPVPDAYATAETVAALLAPDDWDVLVTEARPRNVNDPQGNLVIVHDAIMKARRR
jgi:SAM-dependent methyltransferase